MSRSGTKPTPATWSGSLPVTDRDRSFMSKPVLSVVIPTRNEAASVASFSKRLLFVLAPIGAEVIIVDDSDDDTVAVLRKVADNPAVPVLVRHRGLSGVPQPT